DSDESSSVTTQSGSYAAKSPVVVKGPIQPGSEIQAPQPAVPVPDGWSTEEFFVGGTATSFEDGGDQPSDGMWSATPADEAEYLTRTIVHRPPAEDFSGNVLVEWLNVSAVEASPDWAYLNEEVIREGHAYVQVSAQEQGVIGGETILEAEIDEDVAAEAGADASALPGDGGLVGSDPERYGELVHPGDEFALDIFSQVGKAVAEDPAILGGLEVENVIGLGESQSAFFLTTYANAIQPMDPTYDGLIIHSRGGAAAPLQGLGDVDREAESAIESDAVLIRTDLDIPVLVFQAETDMTVLGYAGARQDDTDLIRIWEAAGTAHADAQLIRAITGGPRDPSAGSLLGCEDPINTGPHKEVLSAGLHGFVEWVAGGEAPPKSPRFEIEDGTDGEPQLVRDENSIVIGGIRTPLVDVPVNAPIGDPPEGLDGGEVSLCALFGQTLPFDTETIVAMYGTPEVYLEQFAASAEKAVQAGFLLQPDADALIVEAQQNAELFG
ncbi:MAG: alpha/beta hydrolase domain-containing protein, partial [Microthrixaceae bacterium]